MVAYMLNLRRPSTTVISIGMEHLSSVKLLLIYLNRLTIIVKYFGGCKIWLESTYQVFVLHRKQDFSNFCSIRCFINSCMEEVQLCVIYNTLLDSNEGDLSPHASQTIYFSNINVNKLSDRETPVESLSLEPQYGTEPLSISSISIIRHSEASSCFSPP